MPLDSVLTYQASDICFSPSLSVFVKIVKLGVSLAAEFLQIKRTLAAKLLRHDKLPQHAHVQYGSTSSPEHAGATRDDTPQTRHQESTPTSTGQQNLPLQHQGLDTPAATPMDFTSKARPQGAYHDYNFNPLIDDRCHRLGLEKMLQWKLDKQKGVIVDVYWRTWGDVVDGKKRSCDNMLVLQPRRPMEIQWSVGFFEEMAPGKAIWKGDRRKQWTFKWEDGRLPTLGELREAVIERFGVVDWSPSQEEQDGEVVTTDNQPEMI
ncbi:hypothetical protein LTR17_008157 [Elasticomyces elasticus]|nr:hypothetical protein LTR17_008157 [Elasticomyces elasticus]